MHFAGTHKSRPRAGTKTRAGSAHGWCRHVHTPRRHTHESRPCAGTRMRAGSETTHLAAHRTAPAADQPRPSCLRTACPPSRGPACFGTGTHRHVTTNLCEDSALAPPAACLACMCTDASGKPQAFNQTEARKAQHVYHFEMLSASPHPQEAHTRLRSCARGAGALPIARNTHCFQHPLAVNGRRIASSPPETLPMLSAQYLNQNAAPLHHAHTLISLPGSMCASTPAAHNALPQCAPPCLLTAQHLQQMAAPWPHHAQSQTAQPAHHTVPTMLLPEWQTPWHMRTAPPACRSASQPAPPAASPCWPAAVRAACPGTACTHAHTATAAAATERVVRLERGWVTFWGAAHCQQRRLQQSCSDQGGEKGGGHPAHT